jgi:hypothetical protein
MGTDQALRDENTALKSEVQRLRDSLNIDKTGLASALNECRRAANGRRWICQGRGPYTYDDDRYREETGHLIDEVNAIAEKALNESGKLATAVLRDGFVPVVDERPSDPWRWVPWRAA